MMRVGKKLKLTYINELSSEGVLRRVPKIVPIPKLVYCATPALSHKNASRKMDGRIYCILSALKKAKLTPEFRECEIVRLDNIRSATMEEITSVHSTCYISRLEQETKDAKASTKGFSYACRRAENFEESMVEVGTALSVVDKVLEEAKITDMPPVGFALIRPHGKDEECCFFNTLAIAALYAQRVHGIKRVFIIDFDVDYGTETSETFYKDPDVLYLSTHEGGSFPNGFAGINENIRNGDGEGTTINVELPNLTGDVSISYVFHEVIKPAVIKFKPDIILVSAGYNGHILDEDYRFQMTTGGYYRLASNIKRLARNACEGRCIFFLDGGYHVTSLSESVVESFRALVDDGSIAPNYSFLLDYEPAYEVKQVIKRVQYLHSLCPKETSSYLF